MKLLTVLGYSLFFAAAAGVVAWGTFAKYQNGVGIIYHLRHNGLDVPAAIGLGVGFFYLIYSLFFKGKSKSQDGAP